MATAGKRDMQRGYGSQERPVVGELWERDATGRSTAMMSTGDVEPNNRRVDFARYYDPEHFKAELEHVWSKQWLFACREEDIPNVGDRVPFDVGPLSYFIIRAAVGQFKAFYNSCLHRGTILCSKTESAETIRCPYHGWEWNLDGRLKRIPSHWDFGENTRLNSFLPEVRLDRWGGFIFINADPGASPLADSLGVIQEHCRDFSPEARYTKARYRKTVGANWKVAQEAFMESYHLYATHPEGVPYNGDSQSQYDVFATPAGAIGRMVVPSAVPSMHAASDATPLQAAMVFAQVMHAWHYPKAQMPVIDPTCDIRAQTASWARSAYRQNYGRENTQPDSVMLDSLLYFMYPHFCIWLSEAIPFVYQFTPHASDPNLSYFDVRLLMPYAEGSERPPPEPAVEVGIEESILEKAPKFSFLGLIFDQDMANMPRVQRGLKAADPSQSYARLGLYQEQIIQYWNALLDRDLFRSSSPAEVQA